LAISAEPEGIPRRSIRPLDLYRSINALAETVIGLFKAEVIHRRGPWRSFESVEFATLEWVDWFNNRRLLEPIGSIPPAEAEAAYYAQLEVMPMAASNPSPRASGKLGAVHGDPHPEIERIAVTHDPPPVPGGELQLQPAQKPRSLISSPML
jgi:hypothetical protein